MKQKFNSTVATMTFKDGSVYIADCAAEEYERLEAIVYAKAPETLQGLIESGCSITRYCACSQENVDNLKRFIAKDLTEKGHTVLNNQFGHAEEQSTEVPEINTQEDMTLDVSEIVVTSSRKRPVIIEDIVSHKKARYESIKAVAKALNSKYITIFKYISEQRLVNNRYRITYAD